MKPKYKMIAIEHDYVFGGSSFKITKINHQDQFLIYNEADLQIILSITTDKLGNMNSYKYETADQERLLLSKELPKLPHVNIPSLLNRAILLLN